MLELSLDVSEPDSPQCSQRMACLYQLVNMRNKQECRAELLKRLADTRVTCNNKRQAKLGQGTLGRLVESAYRYHTTADTNLMDVALTRPS